MRLFLLLLACIVCNFQLKAQNDGDFRTKQSGNFSLNTTWEVYSSGTWVSAAAGVIPSSTASVSIQSTHAITLNGSYTIANLNIKTGGELNFENANNRTLTITNDLLIESGGLLQPSINPSGANRTCTVSVGGNATVDGIIDGINYSASYESRLFLIFTGNTDKSFSGTGSVSVYDLTINKGIDTTSTLNMNIPVNLITANTADWQRLTLTNGTLKINVATEWKPYGGGNRTVGTNTTCLWLNHATARVTSADTSTFIMIFGHVRIDAGFLGTASGANITQSLVMNGGTYSVNQSLTISQKFNINNASVYVGNILTIDNTSIHENQITNSNIYVHTGMDLEAKLTINSGTFTTLGYFYLDGNGTGEKGELIINNGTINIGDGNDQFLVTFNGKLYLNNGTINIYGYFSTEDDPATPAIIQILNGNINVDSQYTTNLANSVSQFVITNYTQFSFTGGSLRFINPHADKSSVTRVALSIGGIAGAKNFIGSTIYFGDGVASKNGDNLYPGFYVNASNSVVLDNIVINNPAGIRRKVYIYSTNLTVNNLSLLSSNDTIMINGLVLQINQNVVNQGVIDGSTTASRLHFVGSTPQNISGSGKIHGKLRKVIFNNSSPTGISIDMAVTADTVALLDGLVYNSNNITVAGTSVASLIGGSSTEYFTGPLTRTFPRSLSNVTYSFPVGESEFNLFQLTGITTVGVSGSTGTITVDANDVPTTGIGGNGVRNPLNALNTYFTFTTSMGAFTSFNINKINIRKAYTYPPLRVIAITTGTQIGGTYTGLGGTYDAGSLSTLSDNFPETNLYPSGTAYITIAEIEPLSGTYTVGNTGNFLNLTAVAAILRQKIVDDYVVFQLQADYDPATETLPIVFDVHSTSMPQYYTTIRPGVSGIHTALNGNASQAIIQLKGIQKLVFDGRVNGAGTADWTISNTNTTTAGPVFEFSNDASTDTLKYLNINGASKSHSSGTIVIGNGTNNGNNNNVIFNCAIGDYSGNFPFNAIFSDASVAVVNSGNKIVQNKIFNYWNSDSSMYGVYLGKNTADWTVSYNKFYQTSARVHTGDGIHHAIWINNTSGSNFNITGNVIGFANEMGTGYTEMGGGTLIFRGIRLNSSGANISNLQSNIISGIKFNTASTNNGYGIFSGIIVESGLWNIGGAGGGNLIGTTGNFTDYPIEITYNAAGGLVLPYYILSISSLNISYNEVGGIQILGNYDAYLYPFRFNPNNTNAIYTISNNTIGSTIKANSIQMGQLAYNISISRIIAIYNESATSPVISNNIIANLTTLNTSSGTNGYLRGIHQVNGYANIYGNTITNLTAYNSNTNSTTVQNITGIYKSSTTAGDVIYNNTIHSLQNLNTANASTHISGIYWTGNPVTPGILKQNKIYSFHNTSTNGKLYGMYIRDGAALVHNNMISLGIAPDGSSSTASLEIIGIYYYSNKKCDFLYNSVYVGGTNVVSGSVATYSFFKKETMAANILNNIFENSRSNTSGTGTHYSFYTPSFTGVKFDYNIYYTPGTGGILANIAGVNCTNLQNVRSMPDANDIHSGYGNPLFISPSSDAASINLRLQSINPAEGMGIVIAGITDDIDNTTSRSGINYQPTDIGADEEANSFTADVDIFTPYFIYNSIPNISAPGDVSVNVIIKDDGVGINLSANFPRIYFRRSSVAGGAAEPWSTSMYAVGNYVSGNANSSVWNFTIPETAFSSPDMANLDIVDYYFVAQDAATVPNINYSTFNATTPLHSSIFDAAPTFPGTFEIDYFGVGITMAGNYNIPADFTTLTGTDGFFYQINSAFLTGDVTLTISTDITEPGTYGLKEFAELPSNSNYKINIIPFDANVRTITCNESKKMIRFDGADRVVIDGRNAGTGNYLKFAHTLNDQSVFQFVNNATADTIRHCIIEGSNSLNPSGTIVFDTTFYDAGNGNDNNAIVHNRIKSNTSVPLNVIYSAGNNTHTNDSILISNNIIEDFEINGIWVTATGNGNGWVISSNTIFNTNITSTEQSAIRIEAGGYHDISLNKIGGNDIDNQNTWQNTGLLDFHVIYLNGATNLPNTIANNLITNITLDNNANNSGNTRLLAVANGKANIFNNRIRNIVYKRTNALYSIWSLNGESPIHVSGNEIDSIISTTASDFYPIFVNTDNTFQSQIHTNTIRNIRLSGNGSDFRGINLHNGDFEVNNNTFGGLTSQDSIVVSSGLFEGIYINSAFSGSNINNNSFRNITLRGNYSFNGIYILNAAENILFQIDNNDFGNIELTNTGTGTTFRGMYLQDGYIEVTNNKIGVSGPINISGTATALGISADVAFDANSVFNNNSIRNIYNKGITYGIYTNRAVVHNISDNDFSNWTINENITLAPIRVNAGTANINGNNLSGIQLTNTGAGTSFYGIYCTGATANIGNTSPNIFGTLANPIYNAGSGITSAIFKTGGTVTVTNQDFEYISGAGLLSIIRNEGGTITITSSNIKNLTIDKGTDICAIEATGGTLSVQGSNISDINLSVPATPNSFTAISVSGTAIANLGNVTGNIIGSISSSNNILTDKNIPLVGIWHTSSGTANISNNTISNLTATHTGSTGFLAGIISTGTGSSTIQNNTVFNLSSQFSRTNFNSYHAAQGIYFMGNATSAILQNQIYDIVATGTTNNISSGIVCGGISANVYRNKIYKIRNLSSGTTHSANGIVVTDGTSTTGVHNNMIIVGEDGENPEYAGIRYTGISTSTAYTHFNSVYVKGSSSASNSSHAFIRHSGTMPSVLINNLLINMRSGSNSHYAITNLELNDWTSNSNSYYSNLAAATTNWLGVPLNIHDWKTAVPNDTLSVNLLPVFIDPDNYDLHLATDQNCALNAIAIPISGISIDFDGVTRIHPPVPSDLGADDFVPTGGWGNDVWRGFSNTDWNTASNWSCENIPTAASTVTIASSNNNPLIAAGNSISITDLTIKAGATLSVATTAVLDVSGDITNNGRFVIQSNATTTGALLNAGSISGSGQSIFNRLLAGGEFHYVSSPVNNAWHTIFSNYGAGNNYFNPNFYLYDDNKPLVNNWLQGWDSLACRTSALEPGRGYAHWYTYTATYNIKGTHFNTGNIFFDVTNSNKTFNSDGFNLVGNPYPSPINAQLFLDLNAVTNSAIDGTLYFWDDDLSNGAGYNTTDYATWNGAGVAGSGGVAPNSYIAPTQGFFVHRSTPGTASIEFNNNMRTNQTPVLFKSAQNITRIYLRVNSPENQTNEILLAFLNGASDGYDKLYDSPKLRGNHKLALYSLWNGKEMAIQSADEMSLADTARIMPIGLDIAAEGEYTFSAITENLPAWAYVYLEDKYTGQLHLLSNNNIYVSLPKGKFENRFNILFFNRILEENETKAPSIEQPVFYANGKNICVKFPTSGFEDGTIHIYNALGQLVYTQVTHADILIEIPTNLENGVYLVQWYNTEKQYSAKVQIY